ncbi:MULTISPECIES: hypothetical protein [unclassified Pseudomonas]|jgi:hypothetical protein|uniref:hypothetical protein n=1 Tax=unclassified Pseudomonas TaxID=196821 RepID=UPI002073E1FF|nr:MULTISPECIES: hypothetical protein [unclassified Pseudomonas]GLH33181.1 hypothetical protein BR1R5_25680 [Pseudomonas sp. BR1R-5]
MLQEQLPTPLLEQVQQRLARLLGPSCIVTLASSENDQGVSHYHLAIQHEGHGISLEDSGIISADFADRLLAMVGQVSTLLDSETLKHMASAEPSRPLVWISDRSGPCQTQPSAST